MSQKRPGTHLQPITQVYALKEVGKLGQAVFIYHRPDGLAKCILLKKRHGPRPAAAIVVTSIVIREMCLDDTTGGAAGGGCDVCCGLTAWQPRGQHHGKPYSVC